MIANTPTAWSEQAESVADPVAAVRWTSDGQHERFRAVLAAIAPRFGESLLDFGCGTGALCDYLPNTVDYIGYDWAEGMLVRARREHPGATFRDSPVGSFDLTVCIGTFNLPGSKRQTWKRLSELWRQTRRALAVSLYAGCDPDCLRYTAEECVAFAETTSGLWRLERHRPNDLLLVLWKES